MSVTFDVYVPGRSLIHRLDARVKLVALLALAVSLLLADGPVFLATTTLIIQVLLLCSGVPPPASGPGLASLAAPADPRASSAAPLRPRGTACPPGPGHPPIDGPCAVAWLGGRAPPGGAQLRRLWLAGDHLRTGSRAVSRPPRPPPRMGCRCGDRAPRDSNPRRPVHGNLRRATGPRPQPRWD